MERFLYNAEHKLRDYRTRNPLLIFRNDGHSARVAKTVAVKTYSSGPRGGMEGSRALAAHYGFNRLLSMDIGGTTTDIGLVENPVPFAPGRVARSRECSRRCRCATSSAPASAAARSSASSTVASRSVLKAWAARRAPRVSGSADAKRP